MELKIRNLWDRWYTTMKRYLFPWITILSMDVADPWVTCNICKSANQAIGFEFPADCSRSSMSAAPWPNSVLSSLVLQLPHPFIQAQYSETPSELSSVESHELGHKPAEVGPQTVSTSAVENERKHNNSMCGIYRYKTYRPIKN